MPTEGDTGTHTNGEAVAKSPELDQVCNAFLPYDVQREDDGTGANKRATGGAERRAAAKREGKRLYEMNRAKKSKTKETDRTRDVAECVQGVIQALLFEIIPLLHQAPYTGQKGYEWLR
ncbi:unnamed protein product, partial [Ectocarpus sp. 12 AP-2014]